MDISLIQNNIMDNTNESIEYYYTKANNNYILHIHNPNLESINITDDNKSFYNKLLNMLFDKNKKLKQGCFNYEHFDTDTIYDLDNISLINRFLKTYYSVVLISKDLEPISYLCINNNTIWTVCTNNLFRKKGYMSLLIHHILDIVKQKKLNKIGLNYTYNDLKIEIRNDNPNKDALYNYYKTFGFKEIDNNSSIIMKLIK